MERPGEAVREGSLEEASKTEGSITWQGRKKVQENYTHLFSGMAGSPQALPFMSLFAPHQGPNNTEGEAPPTSGKEPQGAPCWPIMEAQPSLPSLPCWARQLWEASQQEVRAVGAAYDQQGVAKGDIQHRGPHQGWEPGPYELCSEDESQSYRKLRSAP